MITLINGIPLPIFIVFMFIAVVLTLKATIKQFRQHNRPMVNLGITMILACAWCVVARCAGEYLFPNAVISRIILCIGIAIILWLLFSALRMGWQRYRRGELRKEEIQRFKIISVFSIVVIFISAIVFLLAYNLK